MQFRRNKYGAKKTTVFGITFHSKKEANRYLFLKSMFDAKKISNLELQPRFDIHVSGKYIAFYKADFRYSYNGKTIIEDVKGGKATQTSTYRLKKKLVEAIHGIKITEI